MSRYPKVFLSYRREDSAFQTTAIHERLVDAFGAEFVFMDVDNIPLGRDFRTHLQRELADCDVCLAVIGDQWLNACSPSGQRRLDDPLDFVRIELEAALARDIPVIPLLVGRAGVPPAGELPASLAGISYRQGFSVRPGRDFRTDVAGLIRQIQKVPRTAEAPSAEGVASAPPAAQAAPAELETSVQSTGHTAHSTSVISMPDAGVRAGTAAAVIEAAVIEASAGRLWTDPFLRMAFSLSMVTSFWLLTALLVFFLQTERTLLSIPIVFWETLTGPFYAILCAWIARQFTSAGCRLARSIPVVQPIEFAVGLAFLPLILTTDHLVTFDRLRFGPHLEWSEVIGDLSRLVRTGTGMTVALGFLVGGRLATDWRNRRVLVWGIVLLGVSGLGLAMHSVAGLIWSQRLSYVMALFYSLVEIGSWLAVGWASSRLLQQPAASPSGNPTPLEQCPFGADKLACFGLRWAKALRGCGMVAALIAIAVVPIVLHQWYANGILDWNGLFVPLLFMLGCCGLQILLAPAEWAFSFVARLLKLENELGSEARANLVGLLIFPVFIAGLALLSSASMFRGSSLLFDPMLAGFVGVAVSTLLARSALWRFREWIGWAAAMTAGALRISAFSSYSEFGFARDVVANCLGGACLGAGVYWSLAVLLGLSRAFNFANSPKA